MGDKKSDRGRKMHVARIDDPMWLGREARRMSRELLEKEKRPIGDTIEAAAHRLQTKYGVDASIILQGHQREPREMMVSRWMSLFQAHYAAFAARADQAYEDKRNATTAHPALVRLADFVAGRATDETKEG